jgi:hypothetical protein
MGTILDHGVTRVVCTRLSDEVTNYKLGYHIDIRNRKIENKVLKLNYVFKANYREKIGEIIVEGNIAYKDSLKVLKDLEKNWSEKTELHHWIYNIIFRNAVIMVMDLSRHLGLPPPMNIPELKPEKTRKT